MGKNKKPAPEPESEKIIRKLGENLNIGVTEAEKKYRNKNGPDDLSQVNKEKLKCTVCARSLVDLLKRGNEPYVHMLLNVLMCRDCSTFYGDGYFSVDEDGDDKYCRWCGQGGTLYLCSSCTCAFCKKCIKQNLSRQDVKDLESDDWKCLICKPNPLFECRTLCWFLQENYKKKEEEDDEESNEKEKDNYSQKNEQKRGTKRKANDDPVGIRSKRKKSIDSAKGTTDSQKKSNDVSVPDRKRRSQSVKDVEKPDEEKMKATSSTETSSRRRNSKLEKESTPTSVSNNKLRRSSNKVQEIVISDDDEQTPEPSPKKTKHQHSKKSSSKKPTPSTENIDGRPKRSVTRKDVKSPETPKTPSKPSNKKSKNSSGKRGTSKTNNKIETPVKRSRRSNQKNSSYKEESDVESKKSDSGSQLISLDDDNSDNESENKTKSVKGKGKAKLNTASKKSLLSLSKNADNNIVEGSVYVNSAINDVVELTVLINNRCEKLCKRNIQSVDDLINAFKKIKQLMGGVHTNLQLIEKGLDTKMNAWEGINATDINISKESPELEINLDKKDEMKVNTSLNLVNLGETEITSNSIQTKNNMEEKIETFSSNSENIKEENENGTFSSYSQNIKQEKENGTFSITLKKENEGEIETSSIISPEKITLEETETSSCSLPNQKNEDQVDTLSDSAKKENEERINSDSSSEQEEIKEDLKYVEQMDIEDSQAEKKLDQREDINSEVQEEKQEESVELGDENKNNSFKTESDETTAVESASVNNEENKYEQSMLEEDNNKDADDETKEDAINDDIDSSHSIRDDESVDKHVSNDDSRTSKCDIINENDESLNEKLETNDIDSGTTENGKIDNSESDKSQKDDDKDEDICKGSMIGHEELKCNITGKEDDHVKEDLNNCVLESDINGDVLDKNTVLNNINESSKNEENELTSSHLENIVDKKSTPQKKSFLEEKEKEIGQAVDVEKDQPNLHPNEVLSETKKPAEEDTHVTPAKPTQEIKEPKSNSSKSEHVEDREKKKEHSSSESKDQEKGHSSSSESKHQEKNENSTSSRTEDKLSPGTHQQLDRDSSRSSGDRDRHRWSGGWDNRERGHNNWNRNNQDRGAGWQGGRGSSWNRYDDRRPNRGGWGWKR